MRNRIFGCLAFVSCLIAAPAYSGVILSELDPVDVDDNFTSTASEFIAQILFVNETANALDLYWINFDGNRVFYTTIQAGQSYLQGTFLTHPWLLVLNGTGGDTTQGSGTLVSAFLPVTNVGSFGSADYDTAYVSEPGTLALLGLGLLASGFTRRRKAA